MKQGIAGIVLSGGLSSRMGGGDKGLLQLGQRSMLSRVLERVSPQVDTIESAPTATLPFSHHSICR